MPVEYDHKELSKYLHRTGHYWRPDNPNAHNITADNCLLLDKNSNLLRNAIASHQVKDAYFEILSLKYHKRSIIPDGDVGPVTLEVMRMERCPVPDWDIPNGATMPFFDENAEIQLDLENIVKSMQLESEGHGFDSWPLPGCNSNRPQQAIEHSTTVHIDTSRATTSQKASMFEECALVAASEAEMGQHVTHIFDAGVEPSSIAEHDVRYENMRGPIGYAFFPQPGTCNQTLKCRLAIRYDRSILENAALKQHEYKGHSDKLRHTNGGRMNATLLKPAGGRLTWIDDPHERTKRNYFKDGITISTDIVPQIQMLDSEFAVAMFNKLARFKVEPLSLTDSSIDPSSIVILDRKIDFKINGNDVVIQLQIIERGDF